MTGQTHPNDILVVARIAERIHHRQFSPPRVFSLQGILDGRIRGLRLRNVWLTQPAFSQIDEMPAESQQELAALIELSGATIGHVSRWEPETPLSLTDHIEALPAQNASGSRDFGRGYSKAIQDVMALLGRSVAESFE